jgi:hypothetical protein
MVQSGSWLPQQLLVSVDASSARNEASHGSCTDTNSKVSPSTTGQGARATHRPRSTLLSSCFRLLLPFDFGSLLLEPTNNQTPSSCFAFIC